MSQQPSAYLAVGPYRETLSGMLASLELSEGIAKLTGRAGTGKTALLEHLQRELESQGTEVLFLSSAPVSAEALDELLRRRFSLNENSSIHRALGDWLKQGAAPRRLVIIQDNAQELPDESFLSLRLLANIQDDSRGLVQLVLAGTPLLDERLASPALRSLSQYLSQSFRLKPMTPAQVEEFCDALLAGSGMEGHALDRSALRRIHRLSGGEPGRVMQIWRELRQYQELLPPLITARTLRSLVREAGMPAFQTNPAALTAALGAFLLLAALAFWLLRPAGQSQEIASSGGGADAGSLDGGEATPFQQEEEETHEEESAEEFPLAGAPAAVEAALVEAADAGEAVEELPAAARTDTEESDSLAKSPEFEDGRETAAGDTDIAIIELTAFTDAWLASWTRQEPAAYFSHYHSGFNPLYHASREDWRADRETKITAPARIELSYTDFEVLEQEADRVTLRFRLRYESPDYADLTWKELRLRREDGRWLIFIERNLDTAILRA